MFPTPIQPALNHTPPAPDLPVFPKIVPPQPKDDPNWAVAPQYLVISSQAAISPLNANSFSMSAVAALYLLAAAAVGVRAEDAAQAQARAAPPLPLPLEIMNKVYVM